MVDDGDHIASSGFHSQRFNHLRNPIDALKDQAEEFGWSVLSSLKDIGSWFGVVMLMLFLGWLITNVVAMCCLRRYSCRGGGLEGEESSKRVSIISFLVTMCLSTQLLSKTVSSWRSGVLEAQDALAAQEKAAKQKEKKKNKARKRRERLEDLSLSLSKSLTGSQEGSSGDETVGMNPDGRNRKQNLDEEDKISLQDELKRAAKVADSQVKLELRKQLQQK